MKTPAQVSHILTRLLDKPPEKRFSRVAAIVANNRVLLRRAIRRGHSLAAIAKELDVQARTLQKHLHNAQLFFRTPRKKKGAAIRPYKARKK